MVERTRLLRHAPSVSLRTAQAATWEHSQQPSVSSRTITRACYWQRSKENSFSPTRLRMVVGGLGFTSLDCQRKAIGGLLVNNLLNLGVDAEPACAPSQAVPRVGGRQGGTREPRRCFGPVSPSLDSPQGRGNRDSQVVPGSPSQTFGTPRVCFFWVIFTPPSVPQRGHSRKPTTS